MLKRGKDIKKFAYVVRMLANGEVLPPQYKDHPLVNNLAGFRDCHIENDWVLLYFYTANGELVLTLTDTGTHADLF
ncbi:MAG: type II toxin-antitoxin system YafQ family toxin [Kiritimatiellae bacterium]|nr:type II toxin-antitoxin system YafQ family toxin [Kiritimatiellia bacterium]